MVPKKKHLFQHNIQKIFFNLACDPSGPLFYPNADMERRGPSRLAAKNVQIIHTSGDEGTLQRDGHQDWLMGDCGIVQPGSPVNPDYLSFFPFYHSDDQPVVYVPLTLDNHLMCITLYASAFDHVFAAAENDCCPRSERDAWPIGYRMGYMQPNKG